MNRILLIGATGRTGREIVAQLPSGGVRMRALVRSPQTAALPPHVEVMRGDLTVPETLDACLTDIDSVFLVWTAPPATVSPVLERIARQARRVVFLSSPYKTQHPFFQQPNPIRGLHAEIERQIESSGRQWTFVRPGMFSANALYWWEPQLRAGDVVRWPHLAAPTAPIDERDIAAVAVRALCEDGHGGKDYVLTGPESLSQREQISILGDAIGRSLRIEEMPPEGAPEELLPFFPAFVAKMLLGAWAAALGQPALVTSTVAEITSVPARTFREWAVDHAALFRA